LPVGLAILALAIGLLIYLADRPAGRALLIPAAWSWHGGTRLFGSAGAWLPSALHPFAFILLSAAVWPRRAAIAGPCLTWWAIDAVAECTQHPALSVPLVSLWASTPGLDVFARYAERGTFDIADLAALTAGTLVAALVLKRQAPLEVQHDS